MQTNKAKRLVLGEGESIGHKHVLQSKSDFEFAQGEISIRFMLNELGVLTHGRRARSNCAVGSQVPKLSSGRI